MSYISPVKLSLALDSRFQFQNGLFPFCIKVIDGKSTKYIRIGKQLSKEDWERLKKGNRLSKELAELQTYCNQKLHDYQEPVKEVALDVISVMEARAVRLVKQGRPGSAITVRGSKVKLHKYCTSCGITTLIFSMITHAFLDSWQEFIGGKDATKGIYLRELRTVVNEMKVNPYPFKDRYGLHYYS